MNDNSIYHLENVTKYYGDKKVLDVRSLEVLKGERLCIVGPSGAGKSTLLRLMNFLEPPDGGEIQFHQTRFSPADQIPLEVRRQVTTVFQRPILLNRSVLENVNYGLRLRGNLDGKERIQKSLQQVGLTDIAQQKANTLSGGEAQRVSLARAMVLQPEVLLLDEPTANLDPYNVMLIEDIIQNLNRQGVTIVLVTHNIFQARRLADRVAFLLDGSIIEIAPVDRFFNAPADPRTASFVNGDMIY
ncbi:MAG: phosphate ABC transporter ATP-binding protein [Anaerolineales bacterium]